MYMRILFEQLDDKVANSEMGTCFAQSIYEQASMYRGNGRNKLGAAAIVEGIKEEPTSIGKGMDAGDGGRTITFWPKEK